MPPKGKPIRPIKSAGVSGKKFRRVVAKSRLKTLPADPSVVSLDLRAGSLGSLNAYLKRNRGIPDREVALELRKLLSGTSKRSRFRLVVVDHPDLSPDNRGRPKSKSDALTRVERELYAKYRQQLEIIGKTKEARFQTAKDEGRSEMTVRRAIKKVEAALKSEIELEDLRSRRQARLDRLRTER